MMTIARMLSAMVMAAALAGCGASAGRQLGGTLGSVEVANVLGSEITGGEGRYSLGTLLSPYLGTGVDELLDAADQRLAQDVAQTGLETSPDNLATSWSNPDTGHAGTFTPLNTYTSGDGLLCENGGAIIPH